MKPLVQSSSRFAGGGPNETSDPKRPYAIGRITIAKSATVAIASAITPALSHSQRAPPPTRARATVWTEPRSWSSRSVPPARPSGPTPASRSCASSPPGRPSDHGQLAEGVREVHCLDRDGRAGESSFEPCANAVRDPPCPSLCIHRLPLALARSVTRTTCCGFHRRTAAADLVPAQLLARRPPRTTTTTARPGCRARRPHVSGRAYSNRALRVQGGHGSLPSTLTCTSVSHGALLLLPQQLSTAQAENSTPNISPPSAR